MNHVFLSRIANNYGLDPEAAGQFVTDIFRELHRVSVLEGSVQLGALSSTLFSVGEEAAYHLVGLLIDSGDDDHVLLWTEIVKRTIGMNGYLYWPQLAEWLALRAVREQAIAPEVMR